MTEFRLPIETWAVWRKDGEARALSSSGGMATAVSEAWIKNCGIVYGASFVRPFGVEHVRCSTIAELAMLRGSKYVQSSLKGIFKSMAHDLKFGKKVLFIGTPCQVAGIINRFKEYEDQLFTIDIICHGTPTVETLKESLPQSVLKKDFDNMEFRDNGDFKLSVKKENKVIWTRPLAHDLYMKGFFKAIFYRECCYKCIFARQERVSDMTLGDFWGLDMSSVDTTMDKGISLVLLNSEKGNTMMAMVDDDVEKVARPLEEAVAGNKQLRRSMPCTWRYYVYNTLHKRIGFKWSAILAMPDIVIKNLLK